MIFWGEENKQFSSEDEAYFFQLVYCMLHIAYSHLQFSIYMWSGNTYYNFSLYIYICVYVCVCVYTISTNSKCFTHTTILNHKSFMW